MRQLADGLHQLRGFPPNVINVYLAEDVLIDAATRQAERRILRQLQGHHLGAHALSHVHPDHQGASHAICSRLAIPLWCGEGDVARMQTPGDVVAEKAPRWLRRIQERWWVGAPHLVERQLHEGDDVAGFEVLETPGHCPGHVAYWRESDRALIAGDVLYNVNMFTGVPGLHEPPAVFTSDLAQARASIRRLVALEPALMCFGHGPPLRNTAKLTRFAEKLPE